MPKTRIGNVFFKIEIKISVTVAITRMQNTDTLGFHILISLAAPALVWFLFAKPLTTIGPGKSLRYMAIATFVWCILLPIIMIATDATMLSISGETAFVVLKLLSVVAIMLVFQAFIAAKYHKKTIRSSLWSKAIVLMFAANIGEAIYTETKNYFEPGVEERHIVDILNPMIGVLLLIILAANFWDKQVDVAIDKPNKSIRLDAKLGTWFIIAYTVWNMLFRSRLISNTSSLIFATLSLGLPLVAHFTGSGDWLQMRGVGLLSLMIFTFGITPVMYRFNLLPLYNKEGYDEDVDEDNIISKAQDTEGYRWGMIVAGFLATGMAFREVAKS